MININIFVIATVVKLNLHVQASSCFIINKWLPQNSFSRLNSLVYSHLTVVGLISWLCKLYKYLIMSHCTKPCNKKIRVRSTSIHSTYIRTYTDFIRAGKQRIYKFT